MLLLADLLPDASSLPSLRVATLRDRSGMNQPTLDRLTQLLHPTPISGRPLRHVRTGDLASSSRALLLAVWRISKIEARASRHGSRDRVLHDSVTAPHARLLNAPDPVRRRCGTTRRSSTKTVHAMIVGRLIDVINVGGRKCCRPRRRVALMRPGGRTKAAEPRTVTEQHRGYASAGPRLHGRRALRDHFARHCRPDFACSASDRRGPD